MSDVRVAWPPFPPASHSPAPQLLFWSREASLELCSGHVRRFKPTPRGAGLTAASLRSPNTTLAVCSVWSRTVSTVISPIRGTQGVSPMVRRNGSGGGRRATASGGDGRRATARVAERRTEMDTAVRRRW